MYHTKELPNLKDLDGSGEIKITPNKPFEAFKGRYMVRSSAHIFKGNELIATWNPGQILDGFGEVEKPKTTAKKKTFSSKE